MIDVHSHIIPGIDDGSKSIEESFIMLKEAENAGFTNVISTSHYIEKYYEANLEDRQAWINALQIKIKEQGSKLQLHIGTEVFIVPEMDELIKNNKVATLNNSRYILFELPMNTTVAYLEQVIFLLLSMKLVPVIAHPERYQMIQKEPNKVLDLIEKGVLFQMNYASIIGLYGETAKATCVKLLKANMIHFLGSDCHRQGTVYAKMDIIINEIQKIIGREKFYELSTSNPQKILQNELIEIEKPNPIKKGLISFWKK